MKEETRGSRGFHTGGRVKLTPPPPPVKIGLTGSCLGLSSSVKPDPLKPTQLMVVPKTRWAKVYEESMLYQNLTVVNLLSLV